MLEWLPQVLDDVWAVHPRASNREAVPRHAPAHTRTHTPTHTHARTHLDTHSDTHPDTCTYTQVLPPSVLPAGSSLRPHFSDSEASQMPPPPRPGGHAPLGHLTSSHGASSSAGPLPGSRTGKARDACAWSVEFGVRSVAMCGSGKYQLSVTRAPHPSDIQWENLELSAFGMPCHAGSTIE